MCLPSGVLMIPAHALRLQHELHVKTDTLMTSSRHIYECWCDICGSRTRHRRKSQRLHLLHELLTCGERADLGAESMLSRLCPPDPLQAALQTGCWPALTALRACPEQQLDPMSASCLKSKIAFLAEMKRQGAVRAACRRLPMQCTSFAGSAGPGGLWSPSHEPVMILQQSLQAYPASSSPQHCSLFGAFMTAVSAACRLHGEQ